ncbi:MAG: choline-sulfatase, partial [Ilumatobacter sp.]
IPTFAHHLRAGGYQTALVGKMHFVGADQLHGFEDRLTTDIYPADFGWTPNWNDPDGRFDWWFHNMDSVVNAGVVDVSNQLDFDDDVGYRSVRKLRDLARSADDRPWMMTASFTHPHDPYVARQEFWDLYEHDTIPMPTTPPIDGTDPDVELDPHSARLRRVICADSTDISADQIRTARHAYLANISYVDHHIGQMLDVLNTHDMVDDTIVIFTADHGDMLGERGLWYKMSFFEHSARIPLIVTRLGDLSDGSSPGVRAPAGDSPAQAWPTHVGAHTSLLDIAPTMLDIAGIDVPTEMDGRSVLPLLTAPENERTVLGEYLGEGAVAPIFMIRRGDLKFIWSRPDGAQLYDLSNDTAELHNLVGSLEHADVVADFTAEVFTRWDVDAIDADVRASQRARGLVDRALRQGRFEAWDHVPVVDATNQYMRNHLDLNDVESSRRA